MPSPGSADRVLLIDDDRMSRDVLAVLLEAEGYRVQCMDSGDSAILWLRDKHGEVSIVLMDIQMPGLAGPDLGAALRDLCGTATVLLAISGSGIPDGTASSFDGFLMKPFRMEELAEAIAACRATVAGRSPGAPAPDHRLENGSAGGEDRASNQEMGIDTQSRGAEPLAAQVHGSLDERIYRQLRESMPGLQLRQMYGMCVEDVRRRIAAMRELAHRHDADQFSRQAHAIKGGCGMLGASELYRRAAELEKAGLTAAGLNGTPGVNPLDELAAACDRLERILGTRI